MVARSWTQDQLDRLWALSQAAKFSGKRMRWQNVPAEIGHSFAGCQSKLQEMRDRDRDRKAWPKKPPKVAPPSAPIPWPKPPIAKRPLAPLLPTRVDDAAHTRTTSTAKLVMDAELRSRIEVQGITGGLLGDPMPGRSALDRKRAGEVDAPATTFGRPREFSAPVTLATGPLR